LGGEINEGLFNEGVGGVMTPKRPHAVVSPNEPQ
jgi:hypothetical protein